MSVSNQLNFECKELNICFSFYYLKDRKFFEDIYSKIKKSLLTKFQKYIEQKKVNILILQDSYSKHQFLEPGYKNKKGAGYAIKDLRNEDGDEWIILIAKENLSDPVLTNYIFFHELAHCLYNHYTPKNEIDVKYKIDEEIQADDLAIYLLKNLEFNNANLNKLGEFMFDKHFEGYTIEEFILRKKCFFDQLLIL